MTATVLVGSQTENDSASMSGSDSKKRNKLGYHRTAVACGHCRRRKIRCIPSADTAESKCQNCIRLKKECQFYPVDQNGVNTRKTRSNSRAEPSADEPLLSRTSTSPDQPTSSTSESLDAPYVRRTSSNGAWTETSGLVSSPPVRIGSLQSPDQQDWNHSPAHGHMQHAFSQPESHPNGTANMFWIQNENHPSMTYQQQQYGITATSGAFTQEPQLSYQNGFGETRQHTGRQSFSGVPNSGLDQSPNTYRHYSATFPEIERSVTMPVNMFGSGFNEIMHTSPQLVAGPGQFAYDQAFPHQMTHRTQPWYSPPGSQSAFQPHFLPTQQDRKLSRFSS